MARSRATGDPLEVEWMVGAEGLCGLDSCQITSARCSTAWDDAKALEMSRRAMSGLCGTLEVPCMWLWCEIWKQGLLVVIGRSEERKRRQQKETREEKTKREKFSYHHLIS